MAAEVQIRTALPSDRAAMLELTRDVWEGTDYVPFVWNDWLEDSAGWLMAAVLDGRVVGLQHIDRQPDGTAWIEGIRVAADLRGRGIGGLLLDRAVLWAREHGCPWLRLATSSENASSNRIAERAGLSLLGTFANLAADPCLGTGGGVRVAATVEFTCIWDLLAHVLPGEPKTWVYTEGWTAYSLTTRRLLLLLAMGCVVVSGERPDAIAIVSMSALRPSLRIGLLAGSGDGCEQICRWLRARAAEARVSVLRANVEAGAEALAALEAAGFRSRHGHAMLLHGLPLANSSPPLL